MASRTRLSVDERRARLLELGMALFSEKPFDEVGIDEIAARAAISKGLLYHYFPSKRDFYVEVVRAGTTELQAVDSLDGYLAYVEAHADGFAQLLRAGVGADPEVAALVEAARRAFAARVLEAVHPAGPPYPPLLRHAVRGWVGLVEGASLDWVEHGDVPRATVRAFLGEALGGVLAAGSAAGRPGQP